MSVIRISDPQALRPSHVVLIGLAALTLTGSALLLSAAESKTLVDGAIEWHEGSMLRAVVQLLCLNYEFPTIYAGAVKVFMLGLGAGLGALVLGLAVGIGSRAGDEIAADDQIALASTAEGAAAPPREKAHVAPLLVAQALAGLYVLWSLASTRWSLASDLAFWGSVLLVIQFLWSFVLGNGLSPAAARIVSRIMVGVAVLTAALAVWYFYERNPTLRAKFPDGNPLFLAAGLLPGMLIAGALIVEKLAGLRSAGETAKPLRHAALAAAALGVCAWATALADARASQLGLAVGVLAGAFFALRGRKKLVPVILLPILAAGAFYYFSSGSDVGRSASARLREYSWGYAMRMFEAKRIAGHGQGGFVLLGDTFVADNVLTDPLPFAGRVAHAENEWLEVLADLGSVGFVLVATALVLTLRAGMAALPGAPPAQRWALIGLMASLVALVVEECFSPGLRVSGVPTVFYTVIGLIWAMAGSQTRPLVSRVATRWDYRAIAAGVGCIVGPAIVMVSHRDFAAAVDEFRAEGSLREEKFDEAIRLAESGAAGRLDPQRALSSLAQLTQAHIHAAGMLQRRAADREEGAHRTDPPNENMLRLAAEDREKSKEHCAKGSEQLKKLIERSPGFLGSGVMDYWLIRIKAESVARETDGRIATAYIDNAMKALERELQRQPFSMVVAAEYLGTAGGAISFPRQMEVLARPLRHNRIEDSFLPILGDMADAPGTAEALAPLVASARSVVTAPQLPPPDTIEAWAPEVLRAAAAINLLMGHGTEARELMEQAAIACVKLTDKAPIGAAACFEELARARFAAQPTEPAGAIDASDKAAEFAGGGEAGRRMRTIARDHSVAYRLAAGDEAGAERVLRDLAPAGTADELIRRSLGLRYAELADMALRHRLSAEGAASAPEFLPLLIERSKGWVARALELAPDEYRTHFSAAATAMTDGDDAAAMSHLDNALRLGLPPEPAVGFVAEGLRRRPDSVPLREMWKRFREKIPDLPEGPTKPPEPVP